MPENAEGEDILEKEDCEVGNQELEFNWRTLVNGQAEYGHMKTIKGVVDIDEQFD
jgi:hypothetical protein